MAAKKPYIPGCGTYRFRKHLRVSPVIRSCYFVTNVQKNIGTGKQDSVTTKKRPDKNKIAGALSKIDFWCLLFIYNLYSSHLRHCRSYVFYKRPE